MNSTANTHTLTVRQKVAASATELFDAWLDSAKLAEWMRPSDTRRSDVNIDARVGGEFVVLMHTPKGEIPHTGAYQVIDRPRRLVFTWNSPAAGHRNSTVKVDFKPAGRDTEVVLTHEKLPDAGEVEGHTKGWTHILELMSQSYAKAA